MSERERRREREKVERNKGKFPIESSLVTSSTSIRDEFCETNLLSMMFMDPRNIFHSVFLSLMTQM